MNNLQPVIKWSGSKRSQANKIVSYLPKKFNCYFEPFLGGGSILGAVKPQQAVCSDICKPLIELWKLIQSEPMIVSGQYTYMWEMLQKEGHNFYYKIRDEFNTTQSPYCLLFLTRTCVNGLIRFNAKGEFNNSFHHNRKGIAPDKLKNIILNWNQLIQNVDFVSADYQIITKQAKKGDLIYLDPPYFNTNGRYYGRIDYDIFINYLRELNKRKIKFILSYDGIRGEKIYTVNIPKDIYKRHIYISSGNSGFKKIMEKKKEEVYESIYLNY